MTIKKIVAAAGAAAIAAFALVTGASPAVAQYQQATGGPTQEEIAAVPGCEAGCEVVFVEGLPVDVWFAGLRTEDPETGMARSLLAYWAGDSLRGVSEPVEHAYVMAAECGWERDAQRCAVSFGVGAHSSTVVTARLIYNRGIEVTDHVVGAAPEVAIADLDGSGRPDAIVRQSTYEPAYANAPQYWETWLEFEGEFVRSGCGPAQHGPVPPPTTPLYGPCPIR
jgi:hypothetical protein